MKKLTKISQNISTKLKAVDIKECKAWAASLMVMIVVLLTSSDICFAVSNPGVEFSNWAQNQIIAIFTVLVMCFGIFLLVTRKIIQGIMLLIIVGIAAMFIFNPQGIAETIGDTIQSWL